MSSERGNVKRIGVDDVNSKVAGRWVAQRLRVDQLAPFKVSMGAGGLLCVGVRATQGLPGVLAVCDETEAHGGASATNSMERVLTLMASHWDGEFLVRGANIVELDSMGNWDLVVPTWERMQIQSVAFRPVKWVGCKPSSRQALLGVFGPMATTLLSALDSMGFRGIESSQREGA